MGEVTYKGESLFQALGRNGYMQQRGLDVADNGDEVHLLALTSKGVSKAARLVIPKADVNAVIAELSRFVSRRDFLSIASAEAQ